jgi:nucleotide-binding universal stress UspA family protein
MFKHLLVPLDGSRLAEVAIPAAAFLASKTGAGITLVHIIERDAPQTVHGEKHLRDAAEAEAYLQRVAGERFPPTLHASCHVHTAEMRDVARGIANHRLELGHDTVVMASHGYGGVKELLFGTIAQQVVALGSMPVLLVKATADLETFPCRRVLIPHDGVPEHEPALIAGSELAKRTGAEIKLVMVIPTSGTLRGEQAAAGQLLPRATRALLELARADAAEHLRGHAAELRAEGLRAEAEVLRGDPAREIEHTAALFRPDVIVLGTHGKAGTKAFWDGSVAPRVAGRAACSLFFVPVGSPGQGNRTPVR